jgi:competence protein ComEA
VSGVFDLAESRFDPLVPRASRAPSVGAVPTITRPQLAVYAAAAVAIALIGARYLHSAQPTQTSAAARPAGGRPAASQVTVSGAAGGSAIVQVVGAVRRPGVYRMSTEERVDDAVRRAGGATRRADLAGINLAAKVTDGQQLVVPVHGAAPAAAVGGPAAGGAVAGPPINLNTATIEQLDQLDGVGPATAQKIVAYRQQHGGFRSVSELDQVPGIGEKKLAALRDRVRV